ncbi:MAG: 3-isopropylmalate dehydratase small subunit [Alphaproteobacteria bacterium]|nr:3-isopropylmalate dehydratase small subunit [Alphaproteobacteria bacterium]
MEKFTRLRAIAAPLMRQNVDTDVIIRIERLIEADRARLGEHAFEAWRFLPDGSENPDFLLNREPYRRAKILLNGVNFGCGSSREGAVWALMGLGIRCVIAPSFGEIFFNNCFQNGVLPVVLPAASVQEIADEVAGDPAERLVTVDLEAQQVIAPSGKVHGFEIDPLRRTGLLEGLDEIGLTLRRETEIAAFQARDAKARPWVYRT